MKITSMELIHDDQDNKCALAKFTVEYAGLRFTNCALIRLRSGNIIVVPPKGG